jgi:cytochrome d ubiquinol oxidase subunit II
MVSLDLPFVFMVLMGVAMLAYVVLDGFDLGVGILLPLARREEHDIMVASVGPFWDANETWLVLGVGILLVAFPLAHGIILSSLYLPVATMLIALIVRGVSFEFRVKTSGWHQELWNRSFFVGSLVAALAQGYMLAGVITGFRPGALYAVFGLLVGVGLAGGYALLGASWLVIKMEGHLHDRALVWSKIAMLVTAAGVATISLLTPFTNPAIMQKWFSMPRLLYLSPLPILTAASLGGIWFYATQLQQRRIRAEWVPFVLAVWVFVLSFLGLAYSLYPYLIPERMTIWQAAAAESSLRFVFVGACVVLPFIVGYTVFSYRVFWGKARKLTYAEE